uniref:Uncharacterized protein n=1 Tax=Arundo donax TaxID=35708 RepID=A0A0A9G3I4_ARUDO
MARTLGGGLIPRGVAGTCGTRAPGAALACKSISKRKPRTAVDVQDVLRKVAIICHRPQEHDHRVVEGGVRGRGQHRTRCSALPSGLDTLIFWLADHGLREDAVHALPACASCACHRDPVGGACEARGVGELVAGMGCGGVG